MSDFKEKIHEIIFEADTKEGKLFDVVLLILILLSISVVMLESVADINKLYGDYFFRLEWILTILFTIEFVLRLLSVKKPLNYIFSFYGIVDLLAILPAYLVFFTENADGLIIIRTLRLLRVYRIFKLGHFIGEGNQLLKALKSSMAKITVFIGAVLVLVIVLGTLMYIIEGTVPDTQFTSIPKSIYWAIVTLTTVGYGDIAPTSTLGQIVASLIMIFGYGIIAVPTGIVTSEFVLNNKSTNTQSCRDCGFSKHADDALFCKRCGSDLKTERK